MNANNVEKQGNFEWRRTRLHRCSPKYEGQRKKDEGMEKRCAVKTKVSSIKYLMQLITWTELFNKCVTDSTYRFLNNIKVSNCMCRILHLASCNSNLASYVQCSNNNTVHFIVEDYDYKYDIQSVVSVVFGSRRFLFFFFFQMFNDAI